MEKKARNPWVWIPSLYYAEGIPYIVVMAVSVIMYKRLGISNSDIALYTSWLYLPWVIKPLWSPIVDILKSKRWWIVTMQLLIGFGFAGVAFTIPVPNFFQYTLAFLWLLAFSSATHDIAADGFYMIGLSQHEQAWFVGIRSTFYRLAMISGQGILIIFAGYIEGSTGLENSYFETHVSSEHQNLQILHPDSVKTAPFSYDIANDNVQIATYPAKLNLNTQPVPKQHADSVLRLAKEWNVNNGHIADIKKSKNGKNGAQHEEQSLWDRYVTQNLESFLKANFAPEKKSTNNKNESGNLGVVFVKLNKAPVETEEVTVNLGRDSGDKSISLVHGARLSFSSKNWHIPAMVVIQIDPKLSETTSAQFKAQSGNISLAWMVTFFLLAAMFIFFFIYHKIFLPNKEEQKHVVKNVKELMQEFITTFVLFFKKDKIVHILAFLLLYRFAESQIVKLASPFLLDSQEAGGLALTTGEVGIVYGTVGLLALTLGGLLGGFLAAKHGLKTWLIPMAIAINLPDIVYVFLSYTQTDNLLWINVAVAIEQFGYGFGFTAYMLYMIYVSDGEHKTAHFAITTAFMALGMMIPGMFSGWLQELIGYQNFFIWVMLATIPAVAVVFFAPLDPSFGKKNK